MAKFTIHVTQVVPGPPVVSVQKRFRAVANSVRVAVARLFIAHPEYDSASKVTIDVAEDTDEDIS